MKNLYFGVQRFIKDEDGVTAIEYGLLAALIAVAIIAAVNLTATGLKETFNCVALKLGATGASADANC